MNELAPRAHSEHYAPVPGNAAVEVTRSRGRTTLLTDRPTEEVAESIRLGCAHVMGIADTSVDRADVGAAFDLVRGSIDYGRGLRMRTLILARGEVLPLSGGSEVSVRFRPHWEAIGWIAFGGLIALASVVALVGTLVVGDGPLLWPLGGAILFGGFTIWKVNQLRRARRDLEADLLSWVGT